MEKAGNSSPMRPIAIDLFAGAGGMSLGFEQAGFDVIAAVEHDPIHCATHEFNFPDCATICRSIQGVSGNELGSLAENRGGAIDVVFGGPPCQGFSLIGKRATEDPRNRLVLEFVRLVAETATKYFVFENVKGLTVGKHRRFLKELVGEFERCGYWVGLPWQVLNAADFGVPQNRQRVFLVGAREGLPLPEYPSPATRRAGADGILFETAYTPTVWDAIGDLPDAESCEDLLRSDSSVIEYGNPSEYAAILRGIADDPDDFSYPRIFDPTRITSSLRTDHTKESRKRFAETEFGKIEPVSRFFKLDPSGISNTLRAGTASDRGAFTSPRPIHPYYPRCITVREAARLHSYPDWFRFHVTKWHGARQIGNSVPPRLARAVASMVIRALGIAPSKASERIRLGREALLSMNMQQACAYFGVPKNVIPQRTRNGKLEASIGAV